VNLFEFLSWLTEHPEDLERYQTAEGSKQLMNEKGVPEQVQKILLENNLQAAQELIKRELAKYEPYDDIINRYRVVFWVIMHQ
jgi:hypothetical protein